MKAMHVALAFLTAAALMSPSVGGLEAEAEAVHTAKPNSREDFEALFGDVAEAVHTGKGTVLSVDGKGDKILMTEEPQGTHVLSLTHETKIVNVMGNLISAASLQPGDLIREECRAVGDGTFVARQIRLLRPAWMEGASPEL